MDLDNNSDNSETYSFDESDSYENTTTHKKYRLTISLLFLCFGLIYIYSNIDKEEIKLIDYPRYKVTYDQPTINWWEYYSNTCCIITNTTLLNNDCKADDKCKDYINYWLMDYNQTFYTSPWICKCCYEYRSIGSKSYKTYCSYVCLNTLKSL